MKKILIGISCSLLVVLTISGLWATKAVDLDPQDQVIAVSPEEAMSTAADLSTAEMTLQSERIVTGECVGVETAWIDRTLVTIATVAVGEVIKGEDSSTVTVVLPGGTDTNRKFPIAMTYPGAPTLQPGEQAFLFLTREDEVPNGYVVTGFAQGKFSIVEDSQGQQVISRDLTKVRLQGGSGTVRGTKQTLSLSEFKEKVKGYLKHQ